MAHSAFLPGEGVGGWVEKTLQFYPLDQPFPGEETVVLSSVETCGGGDKGSS